MRCRRMDLWGRCVLLFALASGMVAGLNAQAQPGVLYVARDEVVLVPLDECSVFQSMAWGYNSGLGCGGTDEVTTVRPLEFGFDELIEGLEYALAEYDVHVTDVRPPPYVPYFMLLYESGGGRSGAECVATLPNCGAARRNRIAIARVADVCGALDPLALALHAFGRMSGLDVVEEVDDPMALSSSGGEIGTMFLDRCSTLVDSMSVCRADEEHCGETGQNAHRRLLEIYGARRLDQEPPFVWDVLPEDEHEIPWPELSLTLGAQISDQDSFVPIRWTFDAAGVEGLEFYALCTNAACFRSASVESLPVRLELQPGVNYTVTLEASDLHGNEAEPVVRSFSFAGAPPLPDLPDANPGSNDDTTSSGAVNTDGSSTTAAESRGAGCSCESPGRGRGELLLYPVILAFAGRLRLARASRLAFCHSKRPNVGGGLVP
jgi:hypothetical protein